MPKHKRIVRAHYTMDQKLGIVLFDESGNNLNGTLKGNPQWVQVLYVTFHGLWKIDKCVCGGGGDIHKSVFLFQSLILLLLDCFTVCKHEYMNTSPPPNFTYLPRFMYSTRQERNQKYLAIELIRACYTMIYTDYTAKNVV